MIAAADQELKFNKLEQEFIRVMNIKGINTDILKTLELYSDKHGFNNAAAVLADNNSFPGVDIIRFGRSIDEIMERKTIEHTSVLNQFEESIRIFCRYYQYEKINGAERELVDKVPEKAYREALANALVHRAWDVKASVRVSMFDNRIEISSPGGLPEGISEAEYLHDQISILRNPILGNVFFRLKLIEKFGTGIFRINNAYAEAFIKPQYKIYPNSIMVILPVISDDIKLSGTETQIYELLKINQSMTRAEITANTGINKDKLVRLLNSMLEKHIISRNGTGRGVRYSIYADTK